jgi:lysophospholipase L1-like esterase
LLEWRRIVLGQCAKGRVLSKRLRLTNRFNTAPVTFAKVTIGLSEANGGADSPIPVSFGGAASVTAQPGEDVVSDALVFDFDAFEPLAISLYLPETSGQLTKHWNANATTFITAVDGGDQTGTSSGEAFTQKVYSWLGVLGLDVQRDARTRSIVAFGDSITDGWVSAATDPSRLDVTVADKNARYPDYLQRRFDDAGVPVSVLNAGIGGNQILGGGAPTGPSALERFDADAIDVPGVRGVIIFEGIKDLGLAQAPASEIIEGLEKLIDQAKAKDLKVWLATITAASNSPLHGVDVAPNSDRDRQAINDWIRTEADVDGYFDFDEAVHDPANPAILSTQFASPDGLHLNPAGYEKIAAAVDVQAVADATC